MAADTVLEFEVLTAAGEIVTADAGTNSDLFWALRGGGPSAFGVILSATFQTFVDVPSAGATLDINPSHTDNRTLIWEAVTIFHSYANRFVDHGLYVYFEVGVFGLHVQPFLAVNQTSAQLDDIIAPVLRDFDAIGIRYSTTTRQYDTFFALYNDLFEPEGAGISALTGGWVFAKRDITANNTNIINSFKNAQSKGASAIGHIWNPAYGMPNANNSLNPRFRDASVHVIAAMSVSSSATWEQKMAAQKTLTFDVNQKMKEAGPAGFAYVNEVSWRIIAVAIRHRLVLGAGKWLTRMWHAYRPTQTSLTGRPLSMELITLSYLAFARNGTRMVSSMPSPHLGRRIGRLLTMEPSYAGSQTRDELNWVECDWLIYIRVHIYILANRCYCLAGFISQASDGHAGYSHPLTPFAISLVSSPSAPCEM